MISFSKLHQVPPLGSIEAARLQKLMDMDVAFQTRLKELQQRLPYIAYSRAKTGSGLQISKLLRNYFLEYLNRYVQLGPDSFPTSFNVVESFLSFDRGSHFFDLRTEIEHLLSVDDYFKWYAKGELPKNPEVLVDVMSEGSVFRKAFTN